MLERVARMAFLAWNRGDFELVPAIDDPEVETHIALSFLGAEPVYYGPDGHCRAMEEWNEAWSDWDATIEEVIEEGQDRVLVVARVFGEGAASGIRLDAWAAVRYTFRDGRILRVEAAFDPRRHRVLDALGALEAAGLRE
jgi:ketosteroid isomerase-like protein